jgi:CheY-like chemotaxis protein
MEKIKILLIDDDSDDREFFNTAIKELGTNYELTEAFNGKDGIEKLSKMTILPNYIFLDINMPIMDGNETLLEIKKNDDLRYIPIVIYSTSSSKTDEESTIKSGASLFITKPSNIEDIPDLIVKTISMDLVTN